MKMPKSPLNAKSKSKRAMPLQELVETYIISRSGLQSESGDQYRYTLRAFERFLERTATLKDLNDETVNSYVRWRLEKWSQSAAKRDRNSLVVWWRFAAKRKLIDPPPLEGIPVVKLTRRNATAWTLKELEQLLATCDKLPGLMLREGDVIKGRHIWASGVPRSKWWTALFLFLYDTGARISAALSITPADLDLERGLAILRADASKTGLEQVLRLSRQTVEAIREIHDPQAKRVWFYGWSKRKIWVHLGEILLQAGLPRDRSRKFHCFRRTTATLTAAAGRFDLAQTTLGHTTGYMTRNYIDQRAAPSASAADVLPRPVFGQRAGQSVPAEIQPAASNEVAAVLARLSKQDLETLVRLAQALNVQPQTHPVEPNLLEQNPS